MVGGSLTAMRKNNSFSRGYYHNSIKRAGESEGFGGSSRRFDIENSVLGDSRATMRKGMLSNSDNKDFFVVPRQLLPLSNMSAFERKDLVSRLTLELEKIRKVLKKVEFQGTNGFDISSSRDMLSCNNGQTGPQADNFKKLMTSYQDPKLSPSSSKGRGWNRGTSGRFESSNDTSAPITANAIIMKQCETLLKRLMTHQYGWVFNTPVDVVKLNIPDYLTVIKHPMDLGTIKSKMASGAYSNPKEFFADVRLTFSNAMTYNPPGSDVHIMADTLNKFFEVRWKSIEKKLQGTDRQSLPAKSGPNEAIKSVVPPSKKRKVTTIPHEVVLQPIKRVMTDEEKNNLSRQLESLLAEIPVHIIDFLRKHSSNGKESAEDEIEIDIDDLSGDTLFALQKLLDDYVLEKQNSLAKAEPCEMELLHGSGLSNSSLQLYKGNEPVDEDVDIVGNERPVSSYPPVEIEKDIIHRSSKSISAGSSSDPDLSSSSEGEGNNAKPSNAVNLSKAQDSLGSGDHFHEIASVDDLDRNQPVSKLDQLKQRFGQKLSSAESDSGQDVAGDTEPTERQLSPEKRYRAAVLKNRFAETILKAREKTLTQGEKGDPDKLRQEREELETQQRKEKARLQAEAKAAEFARKQAEAKAVAEAKQKRELEREAARQRLQEMERTVEINENSQFLKDLEMLRAAGGEQIPSSVDESSPDHSQDGMGGFMFGGNNPLEQLGLYMKVDEEEEVEEEEGELPVDEMNLNDVEEGEID